mgnify:FL=1
MVYLKIFGLIFLSMAVAWVCIMLIAVFLMARHIYRYGEHHGFKWR